MKGYGLACGEETAVEDDDAAAVLLAAASLFFFEVRVLCLEAFSVRHYIEFLLVITFFVVFYF